MKGQLSIEFLIVILAAIAVLAMMISIANSVKDAGEYSLNLRAGERLLDEVYYNCRLSAIQGEHSKLEFKFYAPVNYTISVRNNTLWLNFTRLNNSRLNKSLEFDCDVNATVDKGLRYLTISNSSLISILNFSNST
jgi:hypothetical protein